ncbi:hypothetical protein ACYATP_08345 [Lactobacillaceae bacterium Melli_B4]
MKRLAIQNGLTSLLVPVRPSFKQDHPKVPFNEYINLKRADGLPFDPWIRTHYRAGGRIIKPIPDAFVVKASVEQWSIWSNQKFPKSGDYIITGHYNLSILI